MSKDKINSLIDELDSSIKWDEFYIDCDRQNEIAEEIVSYKILTIRQLEDILEKLSSKEAKNIINNTIKEVFNSLWWQADLL